MLSISLLAISATDFAMLQLKRRFMAVVSVCVDFPNHYKWIYHRTIKCAWHVLLQIPCNNQQYFLPTLDMLIRWEFTVGGYLLVAHLQIICKAKVNLKNEWNPRRKTFFFVHYFDAHLFTFSNDNCVLYRFLEKFFSFFFVFLIQMYFFDWCCPLNSYIVFIIILYLFL